MSEQKEQELMRVKAEAYDTITDLRNNLNYASQEVSNMSSILSAVAQHLQLDTSKPLNVDMIIEAIDNKK